MVLHEVAAAPAAAGLLVGNQSQRDAAFEPIANRMQVGEGKEGGRGAAFHVDAAAPEHAVLDDVAAKRVAGPAGGVADRENVDVPVQDEVRAGRGAGERRHDVRHGLLRGDHAVLDGVGFEKAPDQVGAGARIAGRIRGVDANEVLEEPHQPLALGVDPANQRVPGIAHGRSVAQ